MNAFDKDGFYHVRDNDVVFPLPEEEWCAENRRLYRQDIMEHGGYVPREFNAKQETT